MFCAQKSFFFILIACFAGLSSCNKGFTLRIGDQDIFAFGSQDSCNFVQNSQGIRVSWKSSTPVHFIITSSVPSEYDSTIIKAAQIWNERKPMNLIQIHRDNAYPATQGSDGVNGIYWLTDWASDQSSEQARTSIKWDISKIREADIKINAKNFRFYKSGEASSPSKISLESLVLHELGHAVGLKHISDSNSSMQPYLAAGIDRNIPGDIDLQSLNCEY